MDGELVKRLPCCGYHDTTAVKWNEFNGVVQCHNCGQVYAALTAQQEPVAWVDDDLEIHFGRNHPEHCGANWKPLYPAPQSGVREGMIPGNNAYAHQLADYAKNTKRAAAENLPQTQEWTLTAPDGRQWRGSSPLNVAAKERNERLTASEQLENIDTSLQVEHETEVKRMVEAFLCWPIPSSVRPDDCVMDRDYPHRRGTNLLTADEATQMVKHILSAAHEVKS